ncbi:MAG: 16S rRNA processing protein RimM [Alphaproteobacteria bacterium]|nr:16S rRNA processing protein RimM [Alphaproteobacteria bacterium]
MSAQTDSAKRVCLGVIVGAKGLKGEVRIKSFTASPEDIGTYGELTSEDGSRQFKLKATGFQKGAVIGRISGVTDRAAADRLKGERLYVTRDALPEADEGTFYYADLIGLSVETVDGVPVGRVRAVDNFGGGDILDVERPGQSSVLVPFAEGIVAGVDMKAGVVRIIPVPGLLDDGGNETNDGGDETTDDPAAKTKADG